ncbi:MAG TPA: uroporphyrinogen decarboxylase family protein [Thermoleophilia bacterium]|nr:uroporphyrinogen decarboxylase family protein [Thermoleophilia bacterium]
MTAAMTSLERVLATLGHQEPDRVPLFLLMTMHGAKELGVGLEEYFSRGENVAEGQLRLREKYGHDCLYNILYAALEVEAWGGEVIFRDDGPANAGEPMILDVERIRSLEPPDVAASPVLARALRATEILKERSHDVPIIGVVMSPFSLPVMQLGFEAYLDLMFERPDLFDRLMAVNEEFCVAWANAQLAAGATAIGYFDPVSSTTIVTPQAYRDTGFKVAQRTIARINGPTATHFASGRCGPILDDVAQTGTAMVGVSGEEDLAALKQAAAGKVSLLGNLNGITMCRWTAEQAEAEVKAAIAAAAPGGGFILSDNHGEIPLQVSDEVLHAVAEATRRWGRYPLDWVDA